MATIEDVLDQVDGLRRDTAKRVQDRFGSVSDLAAATTEQLTEISGIGKVMADRIHTAANAAVSAAKKASTSAKAAAAKPAAGRPAAAKPAAAKPAPKETPVDTAKAIVGKVVDTAEGAAKSVVDVVSGPARRIVEKVTKRGR